MKKFFIFLIGLMMMFSLNSCETYTYATTQDDIYVEADVDVVRSNASFDVVIRHGVPYYMDGVILYYLYKDIYYYPFYYNNYWYVRAYRRPFTHFDNRPYFRPHRYDYRFSPGQYRGFDRNGVTHYRHPNINRPNRRPDVQPRPSRQPRHDNRRPNINNNHTNNRVVPQNHPNTRPTTSRTTPRIDRNQNNHIRGGNFGNRR